MGPGTSKGNADVPRGICDHIKNTGHQGVVATLQRLQGIFLAFV